MLPHKLMFLPPLSQPVNTCIPLALLPLMHPELDYLLLLASLRLTFLLQLAHCSPLLS